MEEALIKRVMPHDEEAESSVIGAMLIDNEAIMVASELITGEDFYQKQMGVVYDTMVELYKAGKPVEPVSLHTSLKRKRSARGGWMYRSYPGKVTRCQHLQILILCRDRCRKIRGQTVDPTERRDCQYLLCRF